VLGCCGLAAILLQLRPELQRVHAKCGMTSIDHPASSVGELPTEQTHYCTVRRAQRLPE